MNISLQMVERVADIIVYRLSISRSRDRKHYVSLLRDRPLSCDCKGWKYHKRCYHTRLVQRLLKNIPN